MSYDDTEAQIKKLEAELERVDREVAQEIVSPPRPQGSILDEKLPHRFGNRSKRRKLEAQIRKLNAK